jgi:NAD(P)-dependent dehydrogenase (short-subunit alcohol dehydrogenase family)
MSTIDDSMSGRVCMVTGATSGIGLVTAQALAQMGATVILVARSAEKGAATVERIKDETDSTEVEYMLADLSIQSEVHRLAEQFERRHDCLHVLVNNAGAVFVARQESADGIEMTFALNHLAGFLLTNLLLDRMKASGQAGASARVVNVASATHRKKVLDFDDLERRKRRYAFMDVYGCSKLANILFTYELAHRLEGTHVTANALHPGFVATNLGANHPLSRLFKPLVNCLAITPEEGAQTSIYLASSPEVEGVTGKYFGKCRAVPSSEESYNAEAARRLWEISAQMTGLETD